MGAAVMHGDANLYLRTVLDHLFTRDLDEMARAAWSHNRDIGVLPDSRWKTFCTLLDRCYPGTRVIVAHEIATAAAERQRNGVTRVTEVFTPLNDVEHSFAQSAHLGARFTQLAPGLVDAAITAVTAFRRDQLVAAAHPARGQILTTVYDSQRKRGKPEWAQCNMPADPPAVAGFVPADDPVPVAFWHSHGKMLMDVMRPRIHQLVDGATQYCETSIYTPSEYLIKPKWVDAFNV